MNAYSYGGETLHSNGQDAEFGTERAPVSAYGQEGSAGGVGNPLPYPASGGAPDRRPAATRSRRRGSRRSARRELDGGGRAHLGSLPGAGEALRHRGDADALTLLHKTHPDELQSDLDLLVEMAREPQRDAAAVHRQLESLKAKLDSFLHKRGIHARG